MAKITIDVDVHCSVCGIVLATNVKELLLRVGPCIKCLNKEYDKGYNAGYKECNFSRDQQEDWKAN